MNNDIKYQIGNAIYATREEDTEHTIDAIFQYLDDYNYLAKPEEKPQVFET